MMRRSLKNKFVFLISTVCILTGIAARAQNTFKYKADLPKIDSNGVYKIKLAPGLVAKSNESLNDIRLLDKNGKFTAYALSKNVFTGHSGNFIEFPEVKSAVSTDTATVYILQRTKAV